MVTINGKKFYESPCMCGVCSFYLDNGKLEGGRRSQSGFCVLFDKQKNYYGNVPRRCSELFEKAQTFPDGTDLVIVRKG